MKGCRLCSPTKRARSSLLQASPPRSTGWATSSSCDDRGKRERQHEREPCLPPVCFYIYITPPLPQSVSFSEMETGPKCVSHYYTKALSNRVIMHRSKKLSCKSAEGSTPVETVFRGFRRGWSEGLSCKSACAARVLTKRNCTATLTHIVSKLPCSYGAVDGT